MDDLTEVAEYFNFLKYLHSRFANHSHGAERHGTTL